MNRPIGQRLSEMGMSESSPSREHQEHSKQHFSVEEIVYKENLADMNRLSEAHRGTETFLQSSTLSKMQKHSHMKRQISDILMESRNNNQRIRDSYQVQCLLGALEENFKKNNWNIATSIIQDIAEKASLSQLYRKRIAKLRLQLSIKEDMISRLQHDLKSKCLNDSSCQKSHYNWLQ